MRHTRIGEGDRAFEVSTLALGAMNFGTSTDEETALAILDRFVEAGGTMIDTANNYNAWIGGHGRDSEDVLGRWLASRSGVRDQVKIATKLGAAHRDLSQPLTADNFQGLSAGIVNREARESLRHLGTDRIDVLYGHVDDRETPIAETVGAFAKLQADGLVGLSGISNVSTWRLAEAHAEARRQGVAPYAVVQQRHSYLYATPVPPRTNWVNADLLDYVKAQGVDGRTKVAVVAYSPLEQGALARDDKPLFDGNDHAGSRPRIQELRAVARDLGATPSQVALAWLMGGENPVIPLVGPSSVEQLDEILGAAELDLPPEIRERLDAV